MAYKYLANETLALSGAGKVLWIQEFDALRSELNDIRTKFGTLLAKLDADVGVTDTNYAATQALAAATFVA